MTNLILKDIMETPILKEGDKGTEENKYGFEGGTIIKIRLVGRHSGYCLILSVQDR